MIYLAKNIRIGRRKTVLKAALCLVLFTLISHQGQAVTIPLNVFSSNGVYQDSMNLSLDITNAVGGAVDFTFHNENTFSSSIARIYFYDTLLLENADIINGEGTSFAYSASPSGLPGANIIDLSPNNKANFSFGADPSPAQNGINPGEWVTIRFNLKENKALIDVLSAIETEKLHIGVHIIALPDGSSEAAGTPEPATIALLGFGAITLLRHRTK